MLGGIIGDIVGSIYEFNNIFTTDFIFFSEKLFFTDDTVLTIATADAFLRSNNFAESYSRYSKEYPGRGYGLMFSEWIHLIEQRPYDSFGNGSAMRVGPVGLVAKTKDDCLDLAKRSAVVTHSHPDGVAGAQATALAVFMANQGAGLADILQMGNSFYPGFQKSIEQLRLESCFDETCQGTMPVVFSCLAHAKSFEDAIRLSISVGGDSDTIACIVGSIAEPLFGIPNDIATTALEYLPRDFCNVIVEFKSRYPVRENY